MASFKDMALVLMVVLLGLATVKGEGVKEPRMTIQKRYKECSLRVECPPYEDRFVHKKDPYSVVWDIEPKKKQLMCQVECGPEKNATFAGATRGTSTSKFEWRIKKDGGYLRRFDAKSNVIQKFTRVWAW